ncbi:MAG: signal peptidase II [Nitrospiraceae bacterium]|nr:signal peptidase II [Nitrospiraceae bacterium]
MHKRAPFFFCLSFVIFALDQATKLAVVSRLAVFDVIRVLPFFNLVYYRNTGSAFGMFRNLGNVFFIAISGLAVIGVSMMIVKDRENRLGFSLILGGAAGNLADRIVRGSVVDFLEVYAGRFYWPAFNVADSALTLGIALLILNAVREAARKR